MDNEKKAFETTVESKVDVQLKVAGDPSMTGNANPVALPFATELPAEPQPANLSQFDSYQHEFVCHGAQEAITKAVKLKMPHLADTASRLLVDVTERKITLDEAKHVLATIEQNLSQQSTSASRSRSAITFVVAAVGICLSFLMLFSSLLVMQINNDVFKATGKATSIASVGTQTAALPAAWQYLSLDHVPKTKSVSGLTSTNFSISNKLARPVSLYWLNYQGEPVLYMTLNPGETRQQQTYATHPWLVQDNEGKNLLLVVAGTDKDENIVVK